MAKSTENHVTKEENKSKVEKLPVNIKEGESKIFVNYNDRRFLIKKIKIKILRFIF